MPLPFLKSPEVRQWSEYIIEGLYYAKEDSSLEFSCWLNTVTPIRVQWPEIRAEIAEYQHQADDLCATT
jgi:hypothetical protein